MTLPEAEQPAIARAVRALRAAIIALYKEYTSMVENELPSTTRAFAIARQSQDIHVRLLPPPFLSLNAAKYSTNREPQKACENNSCSVINF